MKSTHLFCEEYQCFFVFVKLKIRFVLLGQDLIETKILHGGVMI